MQSPSVRRWKELSMSKLLVVLEHTGRSDIAESLSGPAGKKRVAQADPNKQNEVGRVYVRLLEKTPAKTLDHQ